MLICATTGLALPDRLMISDVPQPSAVARMILARQTCFCGALRSIASSRRRSFGTTLIVIPALEACATAHYWARELREFGHEVRLMPAQYVKAYVKRNKNDAADAEAICEAVLRPTMRFVPAKTAEQQAAVLLHRDRERLVRQRTMLVNALRARRLLINGASANLLRSKATNTDPWVIGLRRRRPSLVVAVALANKTARIAWAVMHRQENYQRMATAA